MIGCCGVPNHSRVQTRLRCLQVSFIDRLASSIFNACKTEIESYIQIQVTLTGEREVEKGGLMRGIRGCSPLPTDPAAWPQGLTAEGSRSRHTAPPPASCSLAGCSRLPGWPAERCPFPGPLPSHSVLEPHRRELVPFSTPAEPPG